MSRKHNVKHVRTRSHYPQRLSARGLQKAPPLPKLESLRKLQATAEWLDEHSWVKPQAQAA